jgi:hypothetical protein
VQGKFQMFLWISLIFKIKKKKISTQKGFGMIAHKKMLPVLLKPRLQLLKNVFCLNCCITSGEKTCYKFLTVYFSFDINILRGRDRKLSCYVLSSKVVHDSRSNSLRSQTHTRLAVKSSVVLRPEQSEVFYILQSATFFSNLVND